MTRLAALLLTLLLTAPLRAAEIEGVFALADARAKVTGSASVGVIPLAGMGAELTVALAMRPLGSLSPITRYDLELGKRLHLIAISADGRGFVHEHGDRPAPDGMFRIRLRLPWAGTWHLYADATPAGLGQQVLRFDMELGGAPSHAPLPGVDGADGRYSAKFDSLGLRAGQENRLTLHLLRDGRPAPDLAPYLGVPAHVVFVNTADLGYVHVHAMAGSEAMEHDMGAMHMVAHPARVPPDLTLSVRAPKPGTYWVWLQFMAGERVRTVRFVAEAA